MPEEFNMTVNEYMPLRDVVFYTLRQAILKGEMEPGERLMEIQLAKKLGVSRTPIREAIRKLELEGLVIMIPRRGAEVAGITEKALRDVLEVRRSLEELAKGRTTFTIAHRLTTIRNADVIWVLTEKGIEETGTHEELMEKGGLYHSLYSMYSGKTA